MRHHLRTDQTLTMSEDPSVMVVAVDTPARMNAVLPRVAALQPRGMLTVERAHVVRDDVPTGLDTSEGGEETSLTVHLGRHEGSLREPTHVAVCDLLRRHGVAGATVLVGVDGISHGARRRARFRSRNLDVPSMVLAVGRSEAMERALPELGTVLARPAMTVERVRVCKRDGHLLARPFELPDVDEHGRAIWLKLMVFTSEAHRHEREPVHRALAHRLRQTQARGVTSVRGIWGFHGDHEPHGDRLSRVGRRVPVVSVLVDAPSRVAASFDVVDELTAEHGLVTCERVPAMQYLPAEEPPSPGFGLAHHEF
jgi:PII-like signaling protein